MSRVYSSSSPLSQKNTLWTFCLKRYLLAPSSDQRSRAAHRPFGSAADLLNGGEQLFPVPFARVPSLATPARLLPLSHPTLLPLRPLLPALRTRTRTLFAPSDVRWELAREAVELQSAQMQLQHLLRDSVARKDVEQQSRGRVPQHCRARASPPSHYAQHYPYELLAAFFLRLAQAYVECLDMVGGVRQATQQCQAREDLD